MTLRTSSPTPSADVTLSLMPYRPIHRSALGSPPVLTARVCSAPIGGREVDIYDAPPVERDTISLPNARRAFGELIAHSTRRPGRT